MLRDQAPEGLRKKKEKLISLSAKGTVNQRKT